jgi:small subunit ribosomal protein S20
VGSGPGAAIINRSLFVDREPVRRSRDLVEEGRTVANIKSQIKRNRQNEKRRLRNRAVRSEVHTVQKNAVAAVGTDSESEALRLAVKRIDKAAAKGVLHKNTAARKKSRLMARVRAASNS